MTVIGPRISAFENETFVPGSQTFLPPSSPLSVANTVIPPISPYPEKSISSQLELTSKIAEGKQMNKALAWIKSFDPAFGFTLENIASLVDLINPHTQKQLDFYVQQLLLHILVTLKKSEPDLQKYEEKDEFVGIDLEVAFQPFVNEYQGYLELLIECFLTVSTIADKYRSKNPHLFPETKQALKGIAEFLKEKNYVNRFIVRPWFSNQAGCKIFKDTVSQFLDNLEGNFINPAEELDKFSTKQDKMESSSQSTKEENRVIGEDLINPAEELRKIFVKQDKQGSFYQSTKEENKALKKALESLDVKCLEDFPTSSRPKLVKRIIESLEVLTTVFSLENTNAEIPKDQRDMVVKTVMKLNNHFPTVKSFLDKDSRESLTKAIYELKGVCGLNPVDLSLEKPKECKETWASMA